MNVRKLERLLVLILSQMCIVETPADAEVPGHARRLLSRHQADAGTATCLREPEPEPFVDHAGVLRDSKTGRPIMGQTHGREDYDDGLLRMSTTSP